MTWKLKFICFINKNCPSCGEALDQASYPAATMGAIGFMFLVFVKEGLGFSIIEALIAVVVFALVSSLVLPIELKRAV